MRRLNMTVLVALVSVLGLAMLTSSRVGHAQSGQAVNTAGGPRGVVKATIQDDVQTVGGVAVQLISQKTSIRTTVYTNDRGQYEFPRLEAGDYVLRIARPMEFRRYQKDSVRIDGSPELPEILLERVSESEFLPPTKDILSQLSGAEWLANMAGSAYEKRLFVNACTISCHSGDRPFLNRFSRDDWTKIVHRMNNYGLRSLVRPNGRTELSENGQVIADFLSRVQGLDSEYPPIEPFPRPTGPATRAIVTEYELPWTLVNVHDVSGDAEGNIWFSINRSPFIGKLDPKTGKVESYRIPSLNHPDLPFSQTTTEELGGYPGYHWLHVDQNTGYVWFTNTWVATISRLDPRTGEVKTAVTGVQGNVGLAPDGLSVWRTDGGKLKMWDTRTLFDEIHGINHVEPDREWDLEITRSTYGNFLTADSNFFGGGGRTMVWLDIQKDELREIPLAIGGSRGRGTFDKDGNIWSGAQKLNMYNPKTGTVKQFTPPTPYFHSYSARADKNGEIWSGQQSGGRIGRLNPSSGRWIEYVLPTPWSFDFKSWIDNSTDPPTYWYGDQHGYIVRLQPLE